MEDMKIWEKNPIFSTEGMFIAELNGKSVGRVKGEWKQRKLGQERIDPYVKDYSNPWALN